MSANEMSTALEPVRTGGVVGFAMSATEAQQWALAVREMKRSVLVDGTDFMVIPGTTKPSLLKPGAEMLLLAAGLGSSMAKVSDASDVERGGVTYKASIHRGTFTVAECDGYAGYDEDRFYQSAQQAEAREQANATRWRREPKAEKFVEYRAPWNSVVKMAQKRAFVGAVLNACAASGLFTQDMEDDHSLPPLWDASVVVKPYVDDLSPEQAGELRAWWKVADNGRPLPTLANLTAEQGSRVLIKIGSLTVAPPPPEPPSTPPTPPSPPSAGPTPHGAPGVPQTGEPGEAGEAPSVVSQVAAELAKAPRPAPPIPAPAEKITTWQPPDDGPPLPTGVSDSHLFGVCPPEDKARVDAAWEGGGARLLQARLEWLDAQERAKNPRPTPDPSDDNWEPGPIRENPVAKSVPVLPRAARSLSK